jgi:hypothetical protein
MDSTRSVDIERLRQDIDRTRTDIAQTTGELRRKAGEAMQWQTYVERYPGPMLGAAALLGLAIGRRIARGISGGAARDRGHGYQWTSAAAGMDSVTRIPARAETGGDRFAAASASWQRLAARIEGLVNKVIDDVADAAERALVPALVGGVQAFLDGRGTRPASRPGSPAGTAARAAAEGD